MPKRNAARAGWAAVVVTLSVSGACTSAAPGDGASEVVPEESPAEREATAERAPPPSAEPKAGAPGGLAGIVAKTAEQVRPGGDADTPMPSAADKAAGRGVPWAPTPSELEAAPATAKVTASGLSYQVLVDAPAGDHPGPTDRVTVHYTGWKPTGEQFDSTRTPDAKPPASFGLDKVIAGWTEGVQLMVPGQVVRFWIPGDLAYKDRPRLGGDLVFDIELVRVASTPKPPKAPSDVGAPPTDATVTASGLAYKITRSGTGTTHPGETDKVTVHYSGWTTDGKLFDSSIPRGRMSTFPLNRVIKGWTEGLQLMVEGDVALLWIPEALAYGGKPGKPAGMLVFEVELVTIR